MATVLQGLVDDQDVLQDERVVDMRDAAYRTDIAWSQLTTILDRLQGDPCFSTRIEWRERGILPTNSALGANVLVGDGTITVAAGDGPLFRPGLLVSVSTTSEVFRVVSIAGNVLTVVRGVGTVPATAATSGDKLIIIGSAYAQGADKPEARAAKSVLGYNYTQIQRDSVDISRSAAMSKMYGGAQRDQLRQEALITHKRNLEAQFTRGVRSLGSVGNDTITTCGGAESFIQTNVFNVNGVLTADYLDDKLNGALATGDLSAKVMFGGLTVAKAMSKWYRDKWVPNDQGQTYYGAKVDGFISGAYGQRIPFFLKRDWNAANGYAGKMLVLDMTLIKKRSLQSTVLLTGRQGNGEDRFVDEYLTEESLEFANEAAHALFLGITG